jgi:3-(3-hydroxy-phenyl)propionate hydroxylase
MRRAGAIMTTSAAVRETDVLIVGAGPVGLMLANLLGGYGIACIVIERGDSLIDYPRAVGMDDETLRTFQAAGLVERILPHVIPNQFLTFVNGRRKVLAAIAPSASEFGWARRNGFVQPLADRVLLAGLERFDRVEVCWSHSLETIEQDDGGVSATVVTPDGRAHLRSKYLVGADGGSSTVRHALNVVFEGQSSPAEWLIVDLRNDPLGRPGAFVGADWRRPYASMSIPHGIRRFEFMLKTSETSEVVASPGFVEGLLARLVPDPTAVDIIRRRVYTHSSRLASRFRDRRVLLAGDAAHVMPVFQGQGYNSSIRDAVNLAWKLAAVVKGQATAELLNSYEDERRSHVLAMIQLSTLVGRFVSVRNPLVAGLRDVFFRGISIIPSVKRYLIEMRFKPMPAFTKGAIAPASESESEIVGRLFPQPRVSVRGQNPRLLDDAIGPWFALLAWNNNPLALLDDDARRVARALGAQLVTVRPDQQLSWADEDSADVIIIGDRDGALKKWFDRHDESVVLLRPDRVVAGASIAQRASAMLRAVATATGCPSTSDVIDDLSPRKS